MEEKLHDDFKRKTFAYQVIHINPQKLHQQHKDHDEKREDETAEEGFQYEFVEFFHYMGINAKIKVFLLFLQYEN